MPDIAKINAVAIADIEKLDSILAANIEKVNGLVFSTAPAIATPAVAYSVRLLDSSVGVPTYTGAAMRVRRDTGGTGDDDEADIAFDTSLTDPAISLDSAISNASTGVTATTLGQFINVGTVNGTTYTNPDSLTVTASCYVDEWKDQSGNANDAEQTAQGSQPQIHNGTVNTDLITENGKPAIRFFNDLLTFTQIDFAGAMHLSHVLNQTGYYYSLGGDSGSTYTFSVTPTAYRYTLQSPIGNIMATAALTNGQQFHTQLQRDASNLIETFADNTAGGSSTSSGTFGFDRIGGRTTGAWRDNQQELILWASDISDAQGDIASNVNTYFAIGNFPNPTSGLLATYTGAAAAYSVRQLANTAALSMRVREDATDTETNIGFDANGDLDTAAIAAHCGTANGYVVNWFDQAGSQNDATQSTSGDQPLIYNGTAVINENGKPALNFADGDVMSVSSFSAISQPITLSAVYKTGAVNYGTVFNFAASRDLIDGNLLARWNFGTALTLSQTNNTHLHSFGVASGTNSLFRRNGSLDASGDAGTNSFELQNIFGQNASGTNTPYAQEFIVWGSNQETAGNRTAIETDINTYFSIY